ncbi:hypothetical protein [Halorhabdus amylolytica]|uniref:hypothetical protein n=1 Tax=Halorhabdus amylolytica TaxID=2559573 RepID=UPI0010AA7997|nr:hypothetical protein [Halorhabdus amylolytica]
MSEEYNVMLVDAESVEENSTNDYEWICAIDGAHYEESNEAAGDEIPEGGWNRFYTKGYLKDGFDRVTETPYPDEVHFEVELDGDGIEGGLKLESCYPQESDINGDPLFDPTFNISLAKSRGPISAGVTLFEVDLSPDNGSFDIASNERSAMWTLDLDSWPDSNTDTSAVEFDVVANDGVDGGEIIVKSELGYYYTPWGPGSGGRVYSETNQVTTTASIDTV